MAGRGRQPRQGRRAALAALVALALASLALAARAPAASALAPPTPWDGANPFHCTVQDAGHGTNVPDPGADPYCVHFDKTNQNITQLGIVDFLLKEPARVAAALPKCFYYQEDHWRGSLVQSDASTVLYEFTGHYFFDEATGDGGAWVTGFSVAGQTFDPTALPGFPPAYGQFFGPGTGGIITHNDIPVNTRCVAMAKAEPSAVYAAPNLRARCAPGGTIDRYGIGPVTLGMTEDRVRAVLGAPESVKRGFLGYCVTGGGALEVGQPGDRSGTLGSGGTAPTVMLLTTSRAFALTGAARRTVSVGAPAATLRRALRRKAKPLTRIGRARVYALGGGLLAGVTHGRVAYLGVYDRHALRSKRVVTDYLRRAG